MWKYGKNMPKLRGKWQKKGEKREKNEKNMVKK